MTLDKKIAAVTEAQNLVEEAIGKLAEAGELMTKVKGRLNEFNLRILVQVSQDKLEDLKRYEKELRRGVKNDKITR